MEEMKKERLGEILDDPGFASDPDNGEIIRLGYLRYFGTTREREVALVRLREIRDETARYIAEIEAELERRNSL